MTAAMCHLTNWLRFWCNSINTYVVTARLLQIILESLPTPTFCGLCSLC